MSGTDSHPEAVDRLLEHGRSDNPVRQQYAQKVRLMAVALSQVRRGEPRCLCGWCGGPIEQEDISTAEWLIDAITVKVGPLAESNRQPRS